MVDLITREYFDKLPLGVKKQGMPHMEAIDEFITSASEQVESYCERKFALQTHTDVIYGSGQNKMLLEQYPVRSIVSISYEDQWGGPFSISTSEVRFHPSGYIEFKYPITSGPWRRDRIYTVTYTAGFDPIPGPIKHATALWVTELMRPSFAGPQPERPAELVPLSSEQIIDLLDQYRRRRIG